VNRFAAAAAALVIVSAGAASAGVVAAAASPAPHHLAQATFQTDHQLCYVAAAAGPGITLPPPGSITLDNQFGRFQPTLSRADQHCNPVEKIMPGGHDFPITNPSAHLLCWKITAGTTKQPPVTVTNQFGAGTLSLGDASQLCLPTWKSLTAPPHKTPRQPPGLSHYTCYPVQKVTSGGYKAAQPKLQDEFAAHPVQVTVTFTPSQLCVPTTKTVVTKAGTKVYKIVPGAKELLCFPVSQTPRKTPVFDQDQFTGPGVRMTIQRTLGLCVPSTTPTPHLYWTDDNANGAVSEANLDGSGVMDTLVTDLGAPWGVAVDSSHIYWANAVANTIMESNLDGSGVTTLVTGQDDPLGLAVDSTHIYWANAAAGTIMESNLDGTGATPVITGLSGLDGLAVDSSHIYWTDDNDDTVMEASLTGGSIITLFTGQDGASGVAVDSSHIYWTDGAGGTVMEAPLNGGTVTTVAIGQIGPEGVAVDSSHIYWGNALGSTVMEAPLTGGVPTALITGQAGPRGVVVGPQ
jgi:sugar lactone lactonase YvrE